MNPPIAAFAPEDGEGFSWDHEVQENLNTAINAAIDADDEAAHSIYIEAVGRIFIVDRVTVDRDGDDACEITIHAKPL